MASAASSGARPACLIPEAAPPAFAGGRLRRRVSGADARPELEDILRRCRTVTAADPECEAAWEAKRRHFFGQGKDEK